MEMDLAFFALAIPAVVIAGISKGGFGSGAAFVATPILALKLEPELALGLMLPLLMLIDVANLKPYWRKWDVPNSKTIVAGGLGGVLAGVVFYQITSADAFGQHVIHRLLQTIRLFTLIKAIAQRHGEAQDTG